MKAKVLLALVAGSLLHSCARPEDPLVFLPQDAPLVAIVLPAESFSKKAKDLVSKLPEVRGLFQLIYSFAGLDFLEPQNSKSDGLDPKRTSVFALYDDAFMAILPTIDDLKAKHRLSLRLARFGFVKEGDSLRHFSSKARTAVFLEEDRVIAVCVGNTKRCSLRRAQSFDEIKKASEELGLEDSAVLLLVRPSFFETLSRLLPNDVAGVLQNPLFQPFAHGRIGIYLDHGIAISALFGQTQAKIQASSPPFSDYERFALLGNIRLPPFLRFDPTRILHTTFGLSIPPEAFKDFAFRGSLVIPKGKPLQPSISLDFKNEASAANASALLSPLLSKKLGLQATSAGRRLFIGKESVEYQGAEPWSSSSLLALLLNFDAMQKTFDLPSLDFASGLFSVLDLAWLNASFDGPRFRLDLVVRTK